MRRRFGAMAPYNNLLISKTLLLTIIITGVTQTKALNDSNDLVLTSMEQDALNQLKPEVMDLLAQEYMKTDFYLIRWLRETNLDVIAAKNKLNESSIWRKENNMDEILHEDWSDMLQEYPISFEGHDKANRPLVAVDIGRWNLRGAVNGPNYDRMQRYLRWIMEKIVSEIVRTQNEVDKNVTRALVLIDAGGLGYWTHFCTYCVTTITRWITAMEKNYPRFFEEIVVINTSSLGPVAMNIVRPFLSYETRRILVTFTYRRLDQGLAYLDERAERDQRTTTFGGTKPVYYLIYNNLIYLVNFATPNVIFYPQSLPILPSHLVLT